MESDSENEILCETVDPCRTAFDLELPTYLDRTRPVQIMNHWIHEKDQVNQSRLLVWCASISLFPYIKQTHEKL